MRLVDGAKPTHPAVCPRHARTAPQDHATANTTLRPGATQNARTTSRPAGDAPHNGLRFSRREASAASEAVGWKRLLCGLRIGQSQRTLPRTPATRALPRKTTHPQTRRCALARHRTRAVSRSAGDAPHNGSRISRREASAASEAVGWMRLLCGLWMGQSRRTLPCVPATRALPRKTTQPQTRRCALARHRTRAPLRAPLATRRITACASAAASERSERSGRLEALVMRLVDGAKPTHPAVCPRHARTAAQDRAPANTTPRARVDNNKMLCHSTTQNAHTNSFCWRRAA